MKTNYIKIVEVDAIYKFLVDKFVVWNGLVSHKSVLISHKYEI
jgi:hypothetical protein